MMDGCKHPVNFEWSCIFLHDCKALYIKTIIDQTIDHRHNYSMSSTVGTYAMLF